MRKSLWRPRFTPVSFSLLLTATAETGPDAAARVRHLPGLLKQMGSHGVLPRAETCDRLIGACLDAHEFDVAREVVALAQRAGHSLDPELEDAVARGSRVEDGGSDHEDSHIDDKVEPPLPPSEKCRSDKGR